MSDPCPVEGHHPHAEDACPICRGAAVNDPKARAANPDEPPVDVREVVIATFEAQFASRPWSPGFERNVGRFADAVLAALAPVIRQAQAQEPRDGHALNAVCLLDGCVAHGTATAPIPTAPDDETARPGVDLRPPLGSPERELTYWQHRGPQLRAERDEARAALAAAEATIERVRALADEMDAAGGALGWADALRATLSPDADS